jgi:predicted CXXCH cytochrome family protein
MRIQSMIRGVVAVATVAAVLCFAQDAYAQISMSDTNHPHNLSAGSGGVAIAGEDRVCVFCHTPHPDAILPQPLWNHELTTQTFTPYSSSTLDGGINLTGAVSLMCLSCHDGVTAVDNYGGITTGTATIQSFGTYLNGQTGATLNLTTDLRDEHPVGVDYSADLATGDMNPTTDAIPGGGTVQDLLFTLGAVDQVECASCHDPHGDQSAGTTPLLRMSNAASALCLSCHNK